ncbi:MAG: N-acetylmuramoyl-L-alanine amidase, partial [Streptococcaceae bacterium]|nr:N-acetylmuramoyl-L-alanine amidase [Streptococcaceae bacterium]
MKLKNTLKLSLVLASLPLVFAWIKTSADTIEPNNHPMGYFTQAQTSQAPFALPSDNQGLSRTNAPSDLTSNDGTLPRKDAVDIASYQSWMKQADFNQLKVQGIKTIVIKLTEGTTYTNPYAKSQISMAKAAGLNVAVYHFSTFGVHNTSQAAADAQAIAEAKYFASVAKADGLPSNTVMINDAEYTSGGAPLFDWTISSQKFVNQLKASGFSNGKHYTSASWAVDYTGYMEPRILGAKNMWIAQYLYGKPSASNLQNTKFGAWQYTSQMYFTNFSSHQPVDVSIDYSSFFTGAAVNPPAPSGFINVYRLYNTRNMEHLYTTNKVESDNLTSLPHTDWRYEGIAWQAPVSSST